MQTGSPGTLLRSLCPCWLAGAHACAGGAVSLSFVNLDAEVKFAVSLQLPQSYPLGRLDHTARIWFGGALAASTLPNPGLAPESSCVGAPLLASH